MRNQTSFRLTTTLLPTDTAAKTTDVINKVDSCGCKFKPNFTEETVVLTNDDRTVMETTRAYSCNGALCFTKRGLSDDVSETEVANRKLTRNPGTLAFVTAGAADWIDKDDDVTWTGNQTYTGNLVSCGCATYNGILDTKKGVKYPNFANVSCLQAYADPYGGMFATVDDTGELYRYNAVTCCWDMVSSVALGTYEIRCCATAPAPGTADTIVTLSPEQQSIYLGTAVVTELPKMVDALVVGGGGGGGGACCQYKTYLGGGGGAGGFCVCNNYQISGTDFNVVVGAGGCGGDQDLGTSGGESKFAGIVAGGGGAGGAAVAGKYFGAGSVGGSGGGGALFNYEEGIGGTGNSNFCYGGSHGGAACVNGNQLYGGQGGGAQRGGTHSPDVALGALLNFCGVPDWYSYGGGGAYVCTSSSSCLPFSGNTCTNYCGSGGGGGTWDAKGGDGVSGVVLLAYPTDGSYGYCCATGGDCCYTCGGYKIHKFTSDGTFCIVC